MLISKISSIFSVWFWLCNSLLNDGYSLNVAAFQGNAFYHRRIRLRENQGEKRRALSSSLPYYYGATTQNRDKTTLNLATDDASVELTDDLLKFQKWCTDNGILTPLNLRVRDTPDGPYRFMEYSPDSKSDSSDRPDEIDGGPILRVPLTACIVADTIEELSRELKKERDLGDDSSFAPYIQVLPGLSQLSNSMPRFWSDSKMESVSEFDGGQIYTRVTMDAKNVKEPLDPWAYACVSSRANFVLGRGFAMTPILDMINHDATYPTSAQVVEDDLFLSISKGFNKGQEVFISYGQLTNLDTLCNYGFVAPCNPSNTEFVYVKMISKSPVQVTLSDPTTSIDGSVIDAGALALLRSYLTPPQQLQALLSSPTTDNGEHDTANENSVYPSINTIFAKPISDANEEEVYSFIASFVDEAIYEGNSGIQWAKDNDEIMLMNYFTERVKLLQQSLQHMKKKFPDLLY